MTSLNFEKESLFIEYYIAEGMMEVSLPDILQTPECSQEIDRLEITEVDGRAGIENAFELDSS